MLNSQYNSVCNGEITPIKHFDLYYSQYCQMLMAKKPSINIDWVSLLCNALLHIQPAQYSTLNRTHFFLNTP